MKLLKVLAASIILFGANIFAADCVCGGGDDTLTPATITIDGNMTDWADVILDCDNTQTDPSDETDHDINKTSTGEIQSTGRNIVRFSRTTQGPTSEFAYGATKRAGSSTNTQKFLFYRGGYDGKMHTTTADNGNIVLLAEWQGNQGVVDMYVCDYIEANPGGDPMVWQQENVGDALKHPKNASVPQEWVGTADGYTITGSLDNCREFEDLIAQGSADGFEMEYQVPTSLLKLEGSFPPYHVSTTNTAINDNNPPSGIDDNMGSCPATEDPVVNLSVVKTADNETPAVGENVTYAVTVTNDDESSNTAASGIVANDVLPDDMIYVSHSGTGWDCVIVGQNVDCTYDASLPEGYSSSLYIIASLDAGNPGDTLTNNVHVSSDVDTEGADASAAITVDATPTPTPFVNLSIVKTADNMTPLVGDNVTYTVTVTNDADSTVAASGIKTNDVLPDGMSYVSYDGVNWTCNYSGQEVNCTYNISLPIGESSSVEIVTSLDEGEEGDILTNNVHVTSDVDEDGERTSVEITVDTPCPCNDVESDSSSALNTISSALMILMTLMLGLFFVRREELNTNER